MTIQEANESLQKHLNGPNNEDEGVFQVYNDGTNLLVNVEYIYRLDDVNNLGQWEGYPVKVGRKVSCW